MIKRIASDYAWWAAHYDTILIVRGLGVWHVRYKALNR